MACDFRTFSVLQGSFLIPVLLIFSLFSGIYSQTSVPNVNIPQTSYSVTYGGTVTLVCVVNSNPFQNRVEWQRIANGVSTTLNVTAEPRYSGGSINTPSLTITGAVSGDGGVYVCSATNDAGKGVSGQTVLSVQGNVPTVSVSQTSYSIFVGSSVTLNCFVSGNPAVSFVYWTVTRNGFTQNAQDGRYSNGDINNPSLTITNARQSDTGVFICKAQNSAGTTDSSPISLTVSGTANKDISKRTGDKDGIQDDECQETD